MELAHEAAIGEWLVPSLAAPLLASAPLSLPLQLARADPRLEFKKLLRRAYPTACTLRDFPTALRELRSPAAWHILRTIVACGLLGTLSWCCVRATAALRAAIHRRFAAGVGDLHAPDAFRDWALDNFALVRAALQERLFAVVADLPWLEQHFNICFNWTYLRNCARFCMDDVRRSMNAGSPPVPNTVLAWHDRTKPLAPRFRSAPAAKTVVSAFRKARVREIRLSTRARAKRWSADELRRELRNVVFEVRLSMFTERVAPRARLYEPALASSLASAAAYIARRPPITIVFPESFLPTRPLFPAYFCESENVLVRRYGKKHRVAVCEDIEHDRCACSHPLHAHAPTLASVRSRPDSHRACTFTGTDFLFFCGGCCEPRLVTSKQTFVRLEDACPICSPRARVLPKYPTPRGGRRGQRCSLCRAVSAHTKISFCGGRFVLVFFCARCVRAREPYVPTVHTR